MQIIDGHCDTFLKCYKENISFFADDTKLHLNYNKLKQTNIVLQYFALFIESKYKPYSALEQALKLINFVNKNIFSQNIFFPVLSQKDIIHLGKKPLALLAIEGGEPIGESLEILEILFGLGVRGIGLTWNERNAIGNGCLDTNLGLSMFGKNLIKKMQKMGMVVDCAHLSDRGLADVLDISEKPIIISHANCNTLCSHPRNVSDERLRQLAKNGGLIGITFVPDFLSDKVASIDDIVKHIYHVANLAGIEHVALGSDFDGFDDLPDDIKGAESLSLLINRLETHGFNESDINKITHENHLRILKNTLPK